MRVYTHTFEPYQRFSACVSAISRKGLHVNKHYVCCVYAPLVRALPVVHAVSDTPQGALAQAMKGVQAIGRNTGRPIVPLDKRAGLEFDLAEIEFEPSCKSDRPIDFPYDLSNCTTLA